MCACVCVCVRARAHVRVLTDACPTCVLLVGRATDKKQEELSAKLGHVTQHGDLLGSEAGFAGSMAKRAQMTSVEATQARLAANAKGGANAPHMLSSEEAAAKARSGAKYEHAQALKKALVDALTHVKTKPSYGPYVGEQGAKAGRARLKELKSLPKYAGDYAALVHALARNEVLGCSSTEAAWLLWEWRSITKSNSVDKTGWGV